MSGKRRHQEREAQITARKLRAKQDDLAQGVAVDRTALAPNNSYSQPAFVERGYYVDEPFVCRTCGLPQTWTAAQQKWWYEVAKGSVFSTANLCRSCRRRERAQQEEARTAGGDPNPYKRAGLLLARVRSALEPELLSAGFVCSGRNPRSARRTLFLDYGRSGDLLTISWDQHEAKLIAELLTDGGADLRAVAEAKISGARSTSEIEARIAPFITSVRSFLVGLRGPRPEGNCL